MRMRPARDAAAPSSWRAAQNSCSNADAYSRVRAGAPIRYTLRAAEQPATTLEQAVQHGHLREFAEPFQALFESATVGHFLAAKVVAHQHAMIAKGRVEFARRHRQELFDDSFLEQDPFRVGTGKT